VREVHIFLGGGWVGEGGNGVDSCRQGDSWIRGWCNVLLPLQVTLEEALACDLGHAVRKINKCSAEAPVLSLTQQLLDLWVGEAIGKSAATASAERARFVNC
jgi:hypothetical protein